MSDDIRRYHRVMTFIPAGMHFAEGVILEGWGRIRNLSVGGIELETHFPLKNAQKVFLTFQIEGFYKFDHSASRVIRVRSNNGYYTAGISFEEGIDREHLREAIVFLVNRA